jgi:hypothetical protein
MICVMGKLSDTHKIPARTAPEILDAFNDALARFERARFPLFRRRKLTAEAMLSAVVLDFLDRTREDQDRIIARNVPRFEAILDGEADPGAGGRGNGQGGTSTNADPASGEPLVPRRGRRGTG